MAPINQWLKDGVNLISFFSTCRAWYASKQAIFALIENIFCFVI